VVVVVLLLLLLVVMVVVVDSVVVLVAVALLVLMLLFSLLLSSTVVFEEEEEEEVWTSRRLCSSCLFPCVRKPAARSSSRSCAQFSVLSAGWLRCPGAGRVPRLVPPQHAPTRPRSHDVVDYLGLQHSLGRRPAAQCLRPRKKTTTTPESRTPIAIIHI
jgi:hypothetical protein